MKKKFTLRMKTRPNGQLPYPFFIDERGMVGRQDFWKGKPEKIIAFTNEACDDEISLEQFLENPNLAIGRYPLMVSKGDKWSTAEDQVEKVDIEFEDSFLPE